MSKEKERKNNMSNYNMTWFEDAIKQYNLQGVQLIPNKQGNTCLSLIYKLETYKTGNLNKKACYDLVKSLACSEEEKQEQGLAENQIQFTKNEDTVYINGKKYSVWDIIKDIKPSRLYNEYLYARDLTQRQKELAYIIKGFLSRDNNMALYLINHIADLDYGMTDNEITERKNEIREYLSTQGE